MGALQMPRYARMAVPLASPLLAGACTRSYVCCFGSNELHATSAGVEAREKGIFPGKPGLDRISPRDRSLKV
jgi:hypothetical protein